MARSDRSAFTFKYMCDDSAVDLNTMLVSQLNFLNALNIIKEAVTPTKAKFSAKIRPLTAGSVPFEIMLHVSWMENLFDLATLAYAERVVNGVASLLSIKQALKGDAPRSVVKNESVITIESQDGSIVTISPKIFDLVQNNKAVDISISNTFRTIQKDEEIDGVEIIKSGEVITRINVSEFKYITAPNPLLGNTDQRSEIKKNVLLIAKSVVFTEGKKWEFLMGGRNIKASLHDEDFFSDVADSRVRFGHGDRFLVNLEVIYEYDSKFDTFTEKEFRIVKVLEQRPYTPPPDPQELDFGQNH